MHRFWPLLPIHSSPTPATVIQQSVLWLPVFFCKIHALAFGQIGFFHRKTGQGFSISYSEGDQPWNFFGRKDAKAETSVLWPPHEKSWLIGKDSDAGRDWGQEEKGTTEDEMAGWHHRLDGRESRWTPGVGDGQGGLACCDSWGREESARTERLIIKRHPLSGSRKLQLTRLLVQVISQAGILEWVDISSPRRSSLSRVWTLITCVSWIGKWNPYHKWHLGALQRPRY